MAVAKTSGEKPTNSGPGEYEFGSFRDRDGGSILQDPSTLQRGNTFKQIHSDPIYENTRQMSLAVRAGSQHRTRNGEGELEEGQDLKGAKTLPRTDEAHSVAQPRGDLGRMHDVSI